MVGLADQVRRSLPPTSRLPKPKSRSNTTRPFGALSRQWDIDLVIPEQAEKLNRVEIGQARVTGTA
jgi:hypothetical protein